MSNKLNTPETLEQLGHIYDKLERLPADKRSVVVMMAEAFINGMFAQEQLAAGQNSA